MCRPNIRLTSLYIGWLLIIGSRSVSAWILRNQNHDNRNDLTQFQPSDLKARIRATQDEDIPHIASILAESINFPSCGFVAKMDQLWAKHDYEKLLLGRLRTIQEGKKTLHRFQRNSPEYHLTAPEKLQVLWHSDRFRSFVAQASKATGEDNLWRHHNLALPPKSPIWLQHVQMTAVTQDDTVCGFCEVAMLSQPLASTYGPAISNLVTSPSVRRKGIASRMLNVAERYARLHWKADSMGLYVEQSNEAAMALYQRRGYQPQTVSRGDQTIGDMWYMSKSLVDEHVVTQV